MSWSITLGDEVGPSTSKLDRMVAEFEQAKLKPVLGRALTNVVRDHFFEINKTKPNRLGGKRTNFYSQAARATTWRDAGSDSIQVFTTQIGVRQRVFGGRITVKTARALTIPVVAEAHGKRASEFEGLVAVGKMDEERGFLAKADELKEGVIRPIFLLRKSVNQRADPSVAPDRRKVTAQIKKVFNMVVERSKRL